MGRPPVPNELKRRRGNPGHRHLPDESNVLILPGAPGVPLPPPDLGVDGRNLWGQVWDGALLWLSPRTDMTAVVEACRLKDDVAIARKRYGATGDPADARALVALNRALTAGLSSLGFDPSARTRLGVAEVKAASAIDRLLERHALRRQGPVSGGNSAGVDG